jgi:hypothetical protein
MKQPSYALPVRGARGSFSKVKYPNLSKLFYALFGSILSTGVDGIRYVANKGITSTDRITNKSDGTFDAVPTGWTDNGDNTYTADGLESYASLKDFTTPLSVGSMVMEVEITGYASGDLVVGFTGGVAGNINSPKMSANGIYRHVVNYTDQDALRAMTSATFSGTMKLLRAYPLSEEAITPTIYGGQGLASSGSMSIFTDVIPKMSERFTWVGEFEVVATGSNHGVVEDTASCTLQVNETSCITNVGLGQSNAHGKAVGEMVKLGVTNDPLEDFYTIYIDGVPYESNHSKVAFDFTTPIALFARNFNSTIDGQFAQIAKDQYFIPEKLTAYEMMAHHNNPEQTIYRDALGNLESAIPSITSAVLTDMETGGGFVYTLSDSLNCREYNDFASNHAIDQCRPVIDVVGTGLVGDAGTGGTVAIIESGREVLCTFTGATENNRPNFVVTNDSNVIGDPYLIDVTLTISVTNPLNLLNFTSSYLSNWGVEPEHSSMVSGTYNIRRVIKFSDPSNNCFMNFDGSTLASGDWISLRINSLSRVDAKLITGMIDTAPRLAGEQIEYGNQMPKFKYNPFGMIGELSPDGLLSFDGKSYVDLGQSLSSAPFEIDLVIDVQPQTEYVEYFGSDAASTNDDVYVISSSSNDLRIPIKIGDGYVNQDVLVSAGLAIITIGWDGVDGFSYANGLNRVVKVNANFTGTTVPVGIGRRKAGGILSNTQQGVVQYIDHVRDATELASDIARLKRQYGIA